MLAKWLFKRVAVLQLGRAWAWVSRRLPDSYLDRKRRWDFRVARALVRRRRMTLALLHDQKLGPSMRLSLLAGYFRQARLDMPSPEDPKTDHTAKS